MEVFGNLKWLKNELKHRYQEMLEDERKRLKQEIEKIAAETEKRKRELEQQISRAAEQQALAESVKLANEVKIRAKREFELAREKLLQEVLKELRKEALKKLKTKEYARFVASKVSGNNLRVTSCLPNLKSELKGISSFKLDKHVQGAIIVSDTAVFDLTIDTLLQEKHTQLREVLAKNLFE
jgi:hypothetical protein